LKFSKLNSLNDYVDNSCDGDDDDDDDDDDNADYLGNSLRLDYEIFAKTLVKLIVSWMEMEMETEMRMETEMKMETVLGMLLKLLLMVSLSGFHFTFKQFGVLTVFCFGFVAPTHNNVPLILIVN